MLNKKLFLILSFILGCTTMTGSAPKKNTSVCEDWRNDFNKSLDSLECLVFKLNKI